MKKLILIFLTSFILVSCGTKEVEAVKVVAQEAAQEAAVEVSAPDSEFSNPTRMAGSSFGSFFVSMLRTQNYDMALKFTSKESIEKFGIDKVKEKYQNFKYNYTLTQKSILKVENTFTLMYSTNEFATGKLKKITVVLENDTCKLVLPDNLDDLLK